MSQPYEMVIVKLKRGRLLHNCRSFFSSLKADTAQATTMHAGSQVLGSWDGCARRVAAA
jgi:hypothetical protein